MVYIPIGISDKTLSDLRQAATLAGSFAPSLFPAGINDEEMVRAFMFYGLTIIEQRIRREV